MKTIIALIGAGFTIVACSGADSQDVNDPVPVMDMRPIPNMPDASNPVMDAGADTSPSTCVTESDSSFCGRGHTNCGALMGVDNCGATRTVLNCGGCQNTESCNNGSCLKSGCVPATDASLCAAINKDCGIVSVVDNCGVMRTPNCGTCEVNFTCTANNCVACVPKTCGANSCGQVNDGCNVAPLDCGACKNKVDSCIANTCSPNMIDHGGVRGVMPTMNLYVIYWGTGFSLTTQSLYTSFLSGIGSSPYAATNTQYLRGAANNITYKASFVDPIGAGVTVSDSSIRAEINNVITAGSLPYDPNGFYFVVTSKNTTVCWDPVTCSCEQFCGYHSYYVDPLARPIVYSSIPSAGACPQNCGIFSADASAPNGNVEADEGVSIIAHELMEAQSDTVVLTGWYDASGASGEVGDKCAYQYGVPAGVITNQTWGGKSWLVQENWSNASSSCVRF